MHWRGHSRTMSDLAVYDDVVIDVCAELSERLAAALAAGIRRDRVVLDPGLGFANRRAQLGAAGPAGRPRGPRPAPALLGASRKRFLGALLAEGDDPRPCPRA